MAKQHTIPKFIITIGKDKSKILTYEEGGKHIDLLIDKYNRKALEKQKAG